ncbi:MAG TPA: GNAT family protein [Dehalococcoidia bacterium]
MQLETERLVLRDFVIEDALDLAACRHGEAFWRYYEVEDDIAGQAREHVAMFVAWQDDQPRTHFQLAIVLKADRRVIGSCGIRQRPQVQYGVSSPGEADIGYELDPAQWRQGYATEAVERLVAFGFGELRLHRVWAFCLLENTASWRVMERLGMRREGVLQSNVWMRARWWDTVVYALLAEEWRSKRET